MEASLESVITTLLAPTVPVKVVPLELVMVRSFVVRRLVARIVPDAFKVRLFAPPKIASLKEMSPAVVCSEVEPVKLVATPKPMDFAERIPALESRSMPEELPSERSPSIEPLADRVTVPAITLFPPI